MIDPRLPLELLGGLTPQQFMRRHWQRKPLLIRQAIPDFRPPLSLAELRQLARRDEVESRLIWRDEKGWHLKHGPFNRLPSAKKPGWTLLTQSVDLHDDDTAELMHRFRFLPDSRLDDAMISIASDGGGVGPHFDSYDVFLLQAHGQRRWRISAQRDLSLEPDLPLKVLSRFTPEEEYVLNPGDMLYLPPHIAHDGIAIGDCMTISIGFRTPTLASLAGGLLEAAADQMAARHGEDGGIYGVPALPGARLPGRYRDAGQPATAHPAALPEALISQTLALGQRIAFDEPLVARYLGIWLSEPAGSALFDPPEQALDLNLQVPRHGELVLDRCTRLLYHGRELYINGEVAPLPAAEALCQLADHRRLSLSGPRRPRLTRAQRELLTDWLAAGWIHYQESDHSTPHDA